MLNRVAMAWLLFTSCSSGSSEKQNEKLSECILGWWERSPASACDCSDAPECSTADCERVRVRRYETAGKFTEGYVLRSPTLATTSTAASLVEGTYSLPDEKNIVLNGIGEPVSTTCSSSRLTIGSFVDTRIEAKLASSLSANVETMGLSWRAAPVGK